MSKAKRLLTELKNRTFEVVLLHGYGNKQRTEDTINAETAFQAAQKFIDAHFPGKKVGSLRQENPDKGQSIWSAPTDASGQRIWVKSKY